MKIARHYVMHAAEGQEEALLRALSALAGAVRSLAGCEGVEMLQDCAEPARFIFIETWQSIEAHKAAGKLLPKEVMSPVMAALSARPEGSYLTYLQV